METSSSTTAKPNSACAQLRHSTLPSDQHLNMLHPHSQAYMAARLRRSRSVARSMGSLTLQYLRQLVVEHDIVVGALPCATGDAV